MASLRSSYAAVICPITSPGGARAAYLGGIIQAFEREVYPPENVERNAQFQLALCYWEPMGQTPWTITIFLEEDIDRLVAIADRDITKVAFRRGVPISAGPLGTVTMDPAQLLRDLIRQTGTQIPVPANGDYLVVESTRHLHALVGNAPSLTDEIVTTVDSGAPEKCATCAARRSAPTSHQP